jgi:DNA-binding IclR family transcriptional regulator
VCAGELEASLYGVVAAPVLDRNRHPVAVLSI